MLPIVEWHTHVIPPEDTLDPHWRGKCPLTIENVIDAHDKTDIALSVVTDSIHQLKDYDKPKALGIDHVLYGSDAPPLTWLNPRAIQLVNDLPVTDTQRARIFAGTALKLMNLRKDEVPEVLRPYAA
jgi:hypothetical protein